MNSHDLIIKQLKASASKMTDAELFNRAKFEFKQFKQGNINPLRNFIMRAIFTELDARKIYRSYAWNKSYHDLKKNVLDEYLAV